jgi:hypothetical protein
MPVDPIPEHAHTVTPRHQWMLSQRTEVLSAEEIGRRAA